MKKFSDRGLLTIALTVILIAGIVAIITINHVQDVYSKQWQEEHGLIIESVGDQKNESKVN